MKKAGVLVILLLLFMAAAAYLYSALLTSAVAPPVTSVVTSPIDQRNTARPIRREENSISVIRQAEAASAAPARPGKPAAAPEPAPSGWASWMQSANPGGLVAEMQAMPKPRAWQEKFRRGPAAGEEAPPPAAPAPASPAPAPAPAPVATVPIRYCPAADKPLTPAECAMLSDPDRTSVAARAALSRPSELYRGQLGAVRFAVSMTAGSDAASGQIAQTAANANALVIGNTTDVVGAVRYARHMEAKLTGEGFDIKPLSPPQVDAGNSGEAIWDWQITPLRADRHELRVEAWTLRLEGGTYVHDQPLHYPPYSVEVPVRWWPDRIGDAMTDTTIWFGQGANWAKALATLIAALGGVWLAIKSFGKAKGA